VGSSSTTSSVDVARLILELAEKSPEPELITHLRLQKLLYYAQGWSLALRKKPLFDEPLEAWKDGPVARRAYAMFKKYKKYPIPFEKTSVDQAVVDKQDRDFIIGVWRRYRRYSAFELRNRTHKEFPYINARHGLKPKDPSSRAISRKDMQSHFLAEYNKHTAGWIGMSCEDFSNAEQDFATGRMVSLHDAFQHLSK